MSLEWSWRSDCDSLERECWGKSTCNFGCAEYLLTHCTALLFPSSLDCVVSPHALFTQPNHWTWFIFSLNDYLFLLLFLGLLSYGQREQDRLQVIGHSLVLAWASVLVGEVMGSIGGWTYPLFSIPLQSHNSLHFPHSSYTSFCPYCLYPIVTSIILLVSYCGTCIFGHRSGMRVGNRHLAWSQLDWQWDWWLLELCLPGLTGLISHTTL